MARRCYQRSMSLAGPHRRTRHHPQRAARLDRCGSSLTGPRPERQRNSGRPPSSTSLSRRSWQTQISHQANHLPALSEPIQPNVNQTYSQNCSTRADQSGAGRSRKTTSRSACKCSTMPGTSILGLRCRSFIPSTRRASAPRSQMRWQCARSINHCAFPASLGGVESEPAGPRLQADLEIKLSSRVAKWTGVSCIG